MPIQENSKSMLIPIFSSTQPWLPLILLLFIPFLSLYLRQQRKKSRLQTNFKPPPSPPKLPIIGNLHLLGKLPHHSFLQLSQKYGPVMLLNLGNIQTLVISSANMAKEVFKTHDIDFCNRPRSPGPKKLTYNFIDVAFAQYGDHWREMRKIFSFELFNTKREQFSWNAREIEVDHMIKSLSQDSSNLVNLDERIRSLVDGVVCKIAFGRSYGGQQFKGQKFRDVLDETMKLLDSFSFEDFFPSFGWILDFLWGISRRLERCFKNLDVFYEKILEEHLDKTANQMDDDDHEDFVDVLVEQSKDKTRAFGLTRDHLKAFLVDAFIGGNATTVATMVWAMSELIKNPRVMNKLQTEIRSYVGKKIKVEPNDIPNLAYLKMVVRETLRMHPPAPLLLPRETLRQCKIGGYDIKTRTRVLINAYAIGRDQNSWKNPSEFYPERFEDSKIDFGGKHFELVPFGGGRRVCPARPMAIATIEYTLANLLYCFDWELPSGLTREDISMEEEGGVTIYKKTPLCLVPIKYKCA